MSYRIQSGLYSGMSWSTPGFHYKLHTWLTTSAASGGAGWTLHDDLSSVTSKYCTWNDGTKTYSCVSHGFYTGLTIKTTGSGQVLIFYVIKVDNDSFRVASTYANALAGTYSTGTYDSNTVYPAVTKIYRNVVFAPSVNQIVRYLAVSIPRYAGSSSEIEYLAIEFREYLWWDTTTHIGRGLWNSSYMPILITSSDVTDHSYDFRGNTSFLSISSSVSSVWYSTYIGSWTSNSAFVESASVIGTLQSGVSAGGNITIQLGSSEASLFTVGNYYFIYDFSAGTYVDYVKIQSRDTGSDQITVDLLNYAYTSGSKIGAYPHRYFRAGWVSAPFRYTDCMQTQSQLSLIPYISVPGYCIHPQSGPIYVIANSEYRSMLCLGISQPTNNGTYYACSPVLFDKVKNNNSAIGCTEGKGIIDYLLFSSATGMTYGTNRRTINGVNYKSFGLVNTSFNLHVADSSALCVLVPDDEVA